MTHPGAMSPPVAARRRAARALLACRWALALCLVAAPGCATTRWVSLRSSPRNPLSDALGLVARQGPKPTPRTVQLLRRYDLEKKQSDKAALLAELNEINRREPNREHVYALAELAYVGGKRAEVAMRQDEALELYGTAVVYAYQYLFDKNYPTASNEYDPQFRQACDLYNAALESTLRIVQSQGSLQPGTSRSRPRRSSGAGSGLPGESRPVCRPGGPGPKKKPADTVVRGSLGLCLPVGQRLT